MGSTWGRQDPGGPHAGHMNLAIWETILWCIYPYSLDITPPEGHKIDTWSHRLRDNNEAVALVI